jgi:hypothetical protein
MYLEAETSSHTSAAPGGACRAPGSSLSSFGGAPPGRGTPLPPLRSSSGAAAADLLPPPGTPRVKRQLSGGSGSSGSGPRRVQFQEAPRGGEPPIGSRGEPALPPGQPQHLAAS